MSRASAGCASKASGSRRSAWISVAPSSPSSAWPSAATAGSMSTYTTRAVGWISRTTSWVLPTVGSPEPRSRNWLTPWSAIQRAARWWKPRFAQAISWNSGTTSLSFAAASRSTGRLW
ncbi:MAG: hypothetical protein DLM62_03590 [Pseudonocardiales bacterium]|nr:MAG: hypothetical protein DLM62_03590 [Pseudonocardiales bacterium]